MSRLQKDIALTLLLKGLLIYFLWTVCFSVNHKVHISGTQASEYLFGSGQSHSLTTPTTSKET